MEKEKKFARTLVTTALPYANGPVHIGHLAGVYVPADIYVRYLRLQGENVLFVGGSDEHGVPVTQRARKEGITPQQVVDRYHAIIRDSFEELGISYDIYSRTTSKTHHQFAAEFFRKLYDDGKLIEKVTKQFYDEQDGKFLAPTATIRQPRATSVRTAAAATWTPPSSSTRTPRTATIRSCSRTPPTGSCPSTSMRAGSRSGFSRAIRNGAATCMASASRGSTTGCSPAP